MPIITSDQRAAVSRKWYDMQYRNSIPATDLCRLFHVQSRLETGGGEEKKKV